MRKVSPEDVRDDFAAHLGDLSIFHEAGLTALSTESERSTFTERSLLAAAVAWESFVSDMFIAYINRDATRFKEHLRASLEEHLNTSPKPRRIFDAFGSIIFPDHLSKAQVQTLADSSGNNITFPNYAELEQRAGVWLIAAHAGKFAGLSPQQKAVIDSLIALRNHIALRSQRSLDAMNDALAKGALHPIGLKRLDNRFHNVGAWLKAKPAGYQVTRLSLIMALLEDIAAVF